MQHGENDDEFAVLEERMNDMDILSSDEIEAKLKGLLGLHPKDWDVIKRAWEKTEDLSTNSGDQSTNSGDQSTNSGDQSTNSGDQYTQGPYRNVSPYPSGTSDEDEPMDFTRSEVMDLSGAKQSIEADDNYRFMDTEEEYTEQEPVISTVGEQGITQETLVQPRISAPSTSIPESTGGSQALPVTNIDADNVDTDDSQSDNADGLHKNRVQKRKKKRGDAPCKKRRVTGQGFKEDKKPPENENQISGNQGESGSVPNNPPTNKNRSDMREFEEFMNQAVELACDLKKLRKLMNEWLSRKGMSELILDGEDLIDGVILKEGEAEMKRRFIERYREMETRKKIREDLERNGLV
ncbi:uncharacterized protein LOC135218285 [Macrobrachium nipponense]|uniref:uncharacterized protein LOC135218285 n=1 Tax=Macrobrachium nipponense TaxID=159736 RepID=UPI0030C8ADF2